MEQALTSQTTINEKETMIVTNHCVNTNHMYIYEIKNGEIINEKMVRKPE